MSRIDEALRRVSQSPGPRATSRPAEVPLRLADELTIEQYPREPRGIPEPVDVPPTPAPREEPFLSRPDPTPASLKPASLKIDANANSRLIVGREKNPMSLEQYRRLAATLYEAQAEKGLRLVMVTSAVPREGKTLTAINLALTLSGSYGKRVLLIDCDLRRPSVHDVLGLPNDKGLTDVFHNMRMELPVSQVSPFLSVLTAGRVEKNPQAGLSSERMKVMLDEAAGRFDWVIIDTPPVGSVSDAQIISRLAQAVVFVIRAGSTPFPLIEKALQDIGPECVIGTVLNGVSEDAMESGYYGGYYHNE
jgi:protein-tyrosine kinase